MRYRSLLHICFDNNRRLARKTHYFEYRGVSFKLVQNDPRKWADHLLTIVPDEATREQAFSAAAEFLSALAWENHARVSLWDAGYRSWHEPHSLRDARPCIHDFPKIGFGGTITGYDISRLPYIETDEQRIALAMFRDARASNNDYLSFLFHWQVFEVRCGGDAVGFIDKTVRRHRADLRLNDEDLLSLPLAGRSLGKYLLDDCRNAVTHLRRRPGCTKLDVDKPADRIRLTRSVRTIEAFSEYFIREALGLKKVTFLMRRNLRAIPVYVAPPNPQ